MLNCFAPFVATFANSIDEKLILQKPAFAAPGESPAQVFQLKYPVVDDAEKPVHRPGKAMPVMMGILTKLHYLTIQLSRNFLFQDIPEPDP